MASVRPKHVIWISTDHMRYDCIGAHGNAAMHTPNLDRLVNQGVSFDRCFVQNAVCQPSRASFMTGLYPQQTGLTCNGHVLRPDFEPTVATTFKAGGFQTAQIGKLHFEQHENHDLDPRSRHDYGFDVFWLSEEAGCYDDAYMTWLHTQYPQYVDLFRVPRSTDPSRITEREGRVLDAPWQASHSGWIGEMGEQYVRYRCMSRKCVSQRQFVHLGFYAPHPPLNPTREMFEPYDGADLPEPTWGEQEWLDKPEPLASMMQSVSDWTLERFMAYRRHFYAMVTGVDLAIGRVLQALEDAGVLDDTLIVFNSDHGDMCGDHHMLLKQQAYYDEVMRMPCVLFWPNGFGKQGRRVSDMVEMVDLLPTLLDLAGCAVPDVMSGQSYAPALLSGDPITGREDALAYAGEGWANLRTATYNYTRYGPGQEVLYNLSEDPGERVNVVASQPRALADMRERLLQRMIDAARSPQPMVYRY